MMYGYNNMYDAVIIGAGVSGAALTRELSRYQLKIAVLEKSSDVCAGASRSNSATVHSGHDATFGTQKGPLQRDGQRDV